jgi:hypothetical protein
MLSLVDELACAALYFLGPQQETALWTISAAGRITGTSVCEAGDWRLSWFPGADRRLVADVSPVDGDNEALADLFGRPAGRARAARIAADLKFC